MTPVRNAIGWLTFLAMAMGTPPVYADAPEAEAGAKESEASVDSDEVRTGLDWIAFPTFKGNSDAGFVYGAQLQMVDYADGEEPFAWELRLKLNHSTKNRHQHFLIFDTPHLLPFDLRYYAELEVLHIADANYFGIGNETRRAARDSTNEFQLTEPRLQTHVRKFVLGNVYAVGGVSLAFSQIDANPGSLLAAEKPIGWDGGRHLAGIIGWGIDSRDSEVVPRSGVFAELYSRFSLTPISQFSWFGGGLKINSYWAPLVDWIVIGNRVMFEALGGTVPVTEMMRIGGMRNVRALGGVYSQRGFAENRFIGPVKGLTNLEIRGYFPPLFGHLVFGAGPFVDVSRVFDGTGDLLETWHLSSGGEFTINWKESFLFRLDYAVSREGGEFYIEGRHMF